MKAAAETRTGAVVAVVLATVTKVVVPHTAAVPGTIIAVAARDGGRAAPRAFRGGQAEVNLWTDLVVVVVVVVVLLLRVAQVQGLPMVVGVLHAAIVGSGHALPPRAGRRWRCRWLAVAPAIAVDHRFWPLCGRQRRPGAGRT